MNKKTRVGISAFALASVLSAGVAFAWPAPGTSVQGGACDGGQRTPITWSITNKESGNKGSPAYIENVSVTVGTISAFVPQPLPNTGSSVATAQSTVSPDYAGPVDLSYTMVWKGTSGTDRRTGSSSLNVVKCEAPPTTSTTAPPSTTVPPTTPPAPNAPSAPSTPTVPTPVIVTPAFTG